jgi:MBG domain
LPVSVTTLPTNIPTRVTYSGSTNAPVNAGTYTVVASSTQTGYLGSSTATLTINKAPQTINFPSPTNTAVGVPEVLTATSTSGLNVTYTASQGTISGNSYKSSVKGTFSITATQAGNANFLAAPPVTKPITVN